MSGTQNQFSLTRVASVHGGAWKANSYQFLNSATAETEDGYTVEVGIGPAFFQGKGITVPFGAKEVYGFDIAAEEGDKTVSRRAWHGNEKIDEDTRTFGSILLTE